MPRLELGPVAAVPHPHVTEDLAADVSAIEPSRGGYRLDCTLAAGRVRLDCERLVLAGGPFNSRLAAQLGIELPIENFLQRKIVVPDPLGVVPGDKVPIVIEQGGVRSRQDVTIAIRP